MKIIKLILIIGAVYFGYNQYQKSFATDTPLAGNWKSNKNLSMKELRKNGITQQQEGFFNKILGKVTYSIDDSSWVSTLDGETRSDSYKIISEYNDCFNVKINSTEDKEVCVVDGNLHVSFTFGDFSGKEVFSPQ